MDNEQSVIDKTGKFLEQKLLKIVDRIETRNGNYKYFLTVLDHDIPFKSEIKEFYSIEHIVYDVDLYKHRDFGLINEDENYPSDGTFSLSFLTTLESKNVSFKKYTGFDGSNCEDGIHTSQSLMFVNGKGFTNNNDNSKAFKQAEKELDKLLTAIGYAGEL